MARAAWQRRPARTGSGFSSVGDEVKALAERAGLLTLARDPSLLVLYLRALGELGESDKLAEFMLAQESTVLTGEVAEPPLLYLFVYTGHVELARQVLASASLGYDEETREAWLALASLHAGNVEQARHGFARLRQSQSAAVRERAERYLGILAQANPYQPPTARTAHIVTHFARAFAERQSLILNRPAQRNERRVTLALVLINALIYAWGSYPLRFTTTSEDFGGALGVLRAGYPLGRVVAHVQLHVRAPPIGFTWS